MPVFVLIIEDNKIDSSKYKSIKKSGNKTIKISIDSKIQNLFKFKSENLFRSKYIYSASTIEESNFLNSNTRVIFTKLKNAFI